MTESTQSEPWESLREIIDSRGAAELEAFLESLAPGERARAIARLEPEQREQILTILAPEEAADLLETLPEAQASALVEDLTAREAAPILHELHSQQQTEVLTSLPAGTADAILQQLPASEARSLRELASYPEDSTGRLMSTEFLVYGDDCTVGDVVRDLRRRPDLEDHAAQYVFVSSADGRLAGVLRLRDLVMKPEAAPVKSIMIREPVAVPVATPLDDLVDLLGRYAFLGLPVVDEEGRLVGVVLRANVEQAAADRSNTDHLKAVGIVGGEELRTMPVRVRAMRRLSWLSVNILLNLGAASIIAFYEDTLSAVIALAMFLPIISDMSGCSGNQAVAVSMRELTLGLIKPRDAWRVWLQEIKVGLINGVMLGLLIGLVVWLVRGSEWLGVVVGTALMVNTLVAVSLGGVIPLLLKGLKVDPALASGPLLTTVTDLCGFFLALSFATVMLEQLTA